MKTLAFVMMLAALTFSDEPDNFYYYELLDQNNNGSLEFRRLVLGRGVISGSDWEKTPNWTGNVQYPNLKYKLYDDFSTEWRGWTGVHPITFEIMLEWTDMVNDIEAAMDAWESVGGSFSPVFWDPSHELGPHQEENYDAIIVYFNNNEDDFVPTDPGLAGIALGAVVQDLDFTQKFWYTYNIAGGSLTEWVRTPPTGELPPPVPIEQTKVMLNSTNPFFDHILPGRDQRQWWTLDADPKSHQWHVPTVVVHELGHILGLSHTFGTGWNDSVVRSNMGAGVVAVPSDNDRTAVQYLKDNNIPPKPPGVDGAIPERFSVSSNFPNPFNAGTTISYELPDDADLRVTAYNMMGQRVRTLFDGMRNAGTYEVRWDGRNERFRDVASGLYLVRFTTPKFQATQKVLLLK